MIGLGVVCGLGGTAGVVVGTGKLVYTPGVAGGVVEVRPVLASV